MNETLGYVLMIVCIAFSVFVSGCSLGISIGMNIGSDSDESDEPKKPEPSELDALDGPR